MGRTLAISQDMLRVVQTENDPEEGDRLIHPLSVTAFHSIYKVWCRETLVSARHTPVLQHGLTFTEELRLQTL
jgi:hypothetical protein